MALTARDDYSAQLDQAELGAVASPLLPSELGGRFRIAYFEFTSPVGDLATTKNIILTRLPKGARVIAGSIVSNTGGCKLDVGLSGADASGFMADGSVADDDDFFLAAGDVSGTAMVAFPVTSALNYGYALTKDCYLTGTVDTAAMTAAKVLKGHVMYVVD